MLPHRKRVNFTAPGVWISGVDGDAVPVSSDPTDMFHATICTGMVKRPPPDSLELTHSNDEAEREKMNRSGQDDDVDIVYSASRPSGSRGVAPGGTSAATPAGASNSGGIAADIVIASVVGQVGPRRSLAKNNSNLQEEPANC